MPKGRPTRFQPAFVRQARLLSRLGADSAALAGAFGVSIATLYRWQERYRDFGLAIAIGRGEGQGLEEPGLYRRATGYRYRAERVFRANGDAPAAIDYTRHVVADAKVALRWLRNRQPAEWRVVPDHAPRRDPSAPVPGKSTRRT